MSDNNQDLYPNMSKLVKRRNDSKTKTNFGTPSALDHFGPLSDLLTSVTFDTNHPMHISAMPGSHAPSVNPTNESLP